MKSRLTVLIILMIVFVILVTTTLVITLPVEAKIGKPGWTCFHGKGTGKPVCLPIYCIDGTYFCTRGIKKK